MLYRESRSDESWPEKSATMRDPAKWNIGIGRLAAFVSNLPGSPTEEQISQYHDIVRLLQEACGYDLSQFRIAPDRIKVIASATTAPAGGAWQTRHPKKRTVEFAYFRGQVQGLIDYVKTNLVGGPS